MQDSVSKGTLSRLAESTPGVSIAVIGLALAMYTYESQRMSSFQIVEHGGTFSVIPSLFALILFFGFALIMYRSRPSFRLHRYIFTGFIIAGFYAVASLLLSEQAFGYMGEQVEFAARIVIRLCEMLILLCWAESLIPLGAKRVALLFGISLLVLGLINIISVFIKVDTAHIFVAAFPFISMTCLYWFKDHSASLDIRPSGKKANAFDAFQVDQSVMPKSTSSTTKASLYLIFLLPLTCYSFVFGISIFHGFPCKMVR